MAGLEIDLQLKILPAPDNAETVVQTTLIKTCQHMADFEERSQLGTWLYRIATNEALMLRRTIECGAAKRVALDPEQTLLDVPAAAPCPPATPRTASDDAGQTA